MRILTLGNGFIASHLPYDIFDQRVPLDENFISREIIGKHFPDVIINCIGKTGHPNIDACENNKAEVAATNTALPILLARMCEQVGIRFIHIGSGCINYGPSPHINDGIDTGWQENDFSHPLSFYSRTKYACDLAIGELSNTTILRIRMPISHVNSPRNLLSKITGYKRVVEEPNSITFLPDLVNAIGWAIHWNKRGVYNITSSTPFTHSVFLEEYRKYVPEHTYERISKEELGKLVVAPRSNCILDNRKAINEGFTFGDERFLLEDTVRQFVEARKK